MYVCVSCTAERRLPQSNNVFLVVLTVPDQKLCKPASLIAARCLGCCLFVPGVQCVRAGGSYLIIVYVCRGMYIWVRVGRRGSSAKATGYVADLAPWNNVIRSWGGGGAGIGEA